MSDAAAKACGGHDGHKHHTAIAEAFGSESFNAQSPGAPKRR